MENKKPIKWVAYCRVATAAQRENKEEASAMSDAEHKNLEARINAALNMKKSAWQK